MTIIHPPEGRPIVYVRNDLRFSALKKTRVLEMKGGICLQVTSASIQPIRVECGEFVGVRNERLCSQYSLQRYNVLLL